MDFVKSSRQAVEWVKKFRWPLVILALGVVLMLLPSGGDADSAQAESGGEDETAAQEASLAEQLAELLGEIEGAGEVRVLLSIAKSEKTTYQTDTAATGAESTVILSGSDKSEYGLVQQVEGPEYLGAIILCQGADDASVRLAISQAVSRLLGLGMDKISVVKMK